MTARPVLKEDIALLRSVLEYRDGQLFWKTRIDRRGQTMPGKPAGSLHKEYGYVFVSVRKQAWAVHRVVWLLHHDSLPGQIDHINGNPADNRIENLRVVSVAENARNRRAGKGSSGHLGVRWSKNSYSWVARITLNGKLHHLGCFRTVEEAIQARKMAEVEMGFHPNHGRKA